MKRFVLSLVLVVLAACGKSSQPTLTVTVRTGIVPGPEFNLVTTDIFDPNDVGNLSLAHSEAQAFFGLPYAAGHTVATFPGVSTGEKMVRVRLYQPNGGLLAEQHVRFTFAQNYSLTVFIDRDCIGVACPGAGSSALQACLGGSCADPRCNPTDPTTMQYCPSTITYCTAPTDCPAVAACATETCASGRCIAVQDDSGSASTACPALEWCNPDPTSGGCAPIPTRTDVTSDGGTTFTPSMCGTVCYENLGPCQTAGYWSCPDGGTPTCVPFLSAVPGSSCGTDGSNQCNRAGDCVLTPELTVTQTSGDPTLQNATFIGLENGVPLTVAVTAGITESTTFFTPTLLNIDVRGTNTCNVSFTNPGITSFDPANGVVSISVQVQGIPNGIVTGSRTCNVVFTAGGSTVSQSFRMIDDDVQAISISSDHSVSGVGSTIDLATLGSISGDGNTIVFVSQTDGLVSGDNNGNRDLFIYDHTFGAPNKLWLVYPPSSEPVPDGVIFSSNVNADSSLIAFTSNATNYTTTNPVTGNIDLDLHAFVMPRPTLSGAGSVWAEPTQIDIAFGGTAAGTGGLGTGAIALAASAHLVGFDAVANDLVMNDTNNATDVFVRDLDHSTTDRVSVTASGGELNGDSSFLSISSSGRFVAYYTAATNADAMLPSGGVVVYDRMTGTLHPIANSANIRHQNVPFAAPNDTTGAVVFSDVDSLEPLVDTNSIEDCYIDAFTAGDPSLFVEGIGPALQNGSQCITPNISTNGFATSFSTDATNIIPGASGATHSQLYLHGTPLFQSVTRVVGPRGHGQFADADATAGRFNTDGTLVLFLSSATNLGTGTTGNNLFITGGF